MRLLLEQPPRLLCRLNTLFEIPCIHSHHNYWHNQPT